MTSAALTFVENRLAEIERSRPTTFSDWSGWDAYHKQGDALLAELERDHGARVRVRPPDSHWMKLGEIACSCTAGKLALVQSWAAKARRAQA